MEIPLSAYRFPVYRTITLQAFKVRVYVLFACLNLMLLLEMMCFPTPVHKPRNCIEEWSRPLDCRVNYYHTQINTHMHRHIQKAYKCTHRDTQKESNTHTHRQKQIHTHTHTHMHTHINTHTTQHSSIAVEIHITPYT